MKYKGKDIDEVFQGKNWEGVRRFTERFGLDRLIFLDAVVKEKDWEKLKEYVKLFSMEPVLEYGLPVGGEGVKELYDLDERFHGQKRKVGAEWWLRDEIEDAVRQLRGYAGDPRFQEKAALLWKEVDAQVDIPRKAKENAFRKVLLTALLGAIYKAEPEEEAALEEIRDLFDRLGFGEGISYEHDFAE
ncbi:MAG: hypothetical protein JW821_19660 [Deltaproteobacteria bacterium]|nr:hypothetical protein [Deltaproteobacteria bacterium]